jgi:hypothetical protein
MADQFTEPPWHSDVDRIIYAVNGRPDQTTVATLRYGAPAELLAAAPDLLRALDDSLTCLEQEFNRATPSAHRNAVLAALDRAETALNRARIGRAENPPTRPWDVNPALPDAERKANERLLDAAADLLDAARKTHAALASHAENCDGVVDALRNAIGRATS